MKYIDAATARKRFESAGMPDGMVQTFMFFYNGQGAIPANLVEYACAIFAHNPGWETGEPMMTIFENSIGANNIFNVRKFFRELGPLAKKWGFTAEQQQRDISEFDSDMKTYSTALIGRVAVKDKFNNPGFVTSHIQEIMDACAAKNGKYYLAAIEFAVWFKLGGKSDDKTLDLLKRYVKPNGVDIKGLLRATEQGDAIVSRQDGNTIKPKVKLQYVKYATQVYKFFADNADAIRDIAKKYEKSNIDFMKAFYNLCVKWNGWSWKIPKITLTQPETRATMREMVMMVMRQITAELPSGAGDAIANVAQHEMAKYAPSVDEQYEYMFDMLIRVFDPKNQQK
ncbi:MAG: hypothetical protein J5613_03420 [Alphaproteobacteria bacterium]|nr:hypothetical protein [Alphaproteobacteria bacterium]